MTKGSPIGSDTDPLFSVVICTHNRANLIVRALKSVLTNPQSNVRYELLIVDNASTDKTYHAVKPYLDSGVVRYVSEPVLGLSQARNTGWKSARGRYVAYLDDDAEATNTWIAAFHEVLQCKERVAACGGKSILVYQGEKPGWLTGESEKYLGSVDFGEQVIKRDWVHGANMVWSREVLEELGGFNTRLGRKGSLPLRGGEESELCWVALEREYALYYVPAAVIHHHTPTSRQTIRYMTLQWFGQGITDFRYRQRERPWTRLSAARVGIVRGRQAVGPGLRMTANVLLRRRRRALRRYFPLMRNVGYCWEALRFALWRSW